MRSVFQEGAGELADGDGEEADLQQAHEEVPDDQPEQDEY